VEYYTPRTILVVDVERFSDDRGSPRTLRRCIDDVSRVRYDLAHEVGHVWLDAHDVNSSGMTAATEAVRWLADAPPVEDWFAVPLLNAPPSGTAPESPVVDIRFNLWSRRAGASINPFGLVRPLVPTQDAHQLPGLPIVLTFRKDALPPDNRVTLLRLLDGILAALRLMLVRVMAALSRRPAVLTFVLVMLAACLRYGRREEPGDYLSLPTRRYQTSLGGCPQQ